MDARGRRAVHVVVMGVSATGKSTVAAALAERLGLDFLEGDDHHPQANIEKMAAGTPLTDDDRAPWLVRLAELLAERDRERTSTALTCSALKRSYRDVLRSAVPGGALHFLHLHAPFEVLVDRMGEREKHFMPSDLLQSQFDTLEPLDVDEDGAVVDVSPSLEQVLVRSESVVRGWM